MPPCHLSGGCVLGYFINIITILAAAIAQIGRKHQITCAYIEIIISILILIISLKVRIVCICVHQ